MDHCFGWGKKICNNSSELNAVALQVCQIPVCERIQQSNVMSVCLQPIFCPKEMKVLLFKVHCGFLKILID